MARSHAPRIPGWQGTIGTLTELAASATMTTAGWHFVDAPALVSEGVDDVATSSTAIPASVGALEAGTTRIKAAVWLLGVPTIELALLAAVAVPSLVADPAGTGSRLQQAGIGWPVGTLLAAAGAALLMAAVWRGWALISVRLMLASGVVWALAGACILATDGNASPLAFAGVALALLATVAWSRRGAS